MIDICANAAFVVLAVSGLFCFYRLVIGPTSSDRVVAVDTLTAVIVAMIAVYSMRENTAIFYDAILVLSVLGFVATVAMAKFLAKGRNIFEQ